MEIESRNVKMIIVLHLQPATIDHRVAFVMLLNCTAAHLESKILSDSFSSSSWDVTQPSEIMACYRKQRTCHKERNLVFRNVFHQYSL